MVRCRSIVQRYDRKKIIPIRELHMIICLAVDCGNVDQPSFGDVNAPETTFQAIATYSCISGYSLVGDSKRTCQANGNWSGQIPKCNRELQ